MTYDSNISTEISLSKVLDEMIVDDTQMDVIVQFLESHENCIKDIFANSIFVYELYDLTIHPENWYDPFFNRHMEMLPHIPLFFAAITHLMYAKANGLKCDTTKFLSMTYGFKEFHYKGLIDDYSILGFEIGISDYINGVEPLGKTCNKYQFDNFIRNSCLILSAFSYHNFSKLSPGAQWLLVKTVSKKLNLRTRTSQVLAFCIVSLMKQILFAGEIETFKYIKDVISSEVHMGLTFTPVFASKIPGELMFDMSQGNIGFVETVFQMNMLDTQFDSLDLFLYICLCNSQLYKSMLDNLDLLEFFNLPFDYNEFLNQKKGGNDIASFLP